MTKVIDTDGNELVWTALYLRYHHAYTEECEDLEEALGFLAYGREQNHLAPTGIRLPDGRVLEGAELDEALKRYEQCSAEIEQRPGSDA